MWVLLYRALYYTVYWSDKGIVLLLFSLFASAGDLTDFLNWFFSAFCLAVQRLDIYFFFKSFRKGLFMISVHKTIVEIQNPEIISVCGLVCSINYRWLSHTQKSLLFSNLSHLTPLHQSMCRFKFWSLKYL